MELIIIGAIALLVIFGIAQYNRLVRLNITVDEAFAQIEVQLKRRADLIPNLVETVKGYAAHEQSTFNAVVEARAKSTSRSPASSPPPEFRRPSSRFRSVPPSTAKSRWAMTSAILTSRPCATRSPAPPR
jgi:hypothetical protein